MTAEYFLNQIFESYRISQLPQEKEFNIEEIKRNLRDLTFSQIEEYRRKIPRDIMYRAAYENVREALIKKCEFTDEGLNVCVGDCC